MFCEILGQGSSQNMGEYSAEYWIRREHYGISGGFLGEGSSKNRQNVQQKFVQVIGQNMAYTQQNIGSGNSKNI
jgi:hypothetical protein